MPTPPNTIIRKYFEYSRSEDVSYCKVKVVELREGIAENAEEQCRTRIKGDKISNLRNHIRCSHKATYEILRKEEDQKHGSSGSLSTLRQPKILDYCSYVAVRVSRINVLRGLLCMVTVDGRPFSALDDIGFTTAFGPVLRNLNHNYNRQNIHELIEAAANYITAKLCKILKEKSNMVSVKVDAASRFSRSFLGVNVQIIYNQMVQLFVLGLEEIKLRHTGDNLKKIILDCLRRYEIYPSRIYSITSDNGSNILKAIRLIDKEYRQLRYKDIPDINPDDEDEVNDLIAILCGNDWADESILAISCAAHTLQLAIQDALKNCWSDDEGTETTFVQHIRAGRELVVTLRKQNNILLLQAKNLSKPRLDVKTRWGSTYTMIDDLLQCKEVCAEAVGRGQFDLFLSNDTWNALKEIRDTLLPSYVATKRLQIEQLTLPDARKVIDICWMKTAEMGTQLAQELVYHFEMRRKQILESDGMLNAVFLDPRQLFDLSIHERISAKKRLTALHIKLQSLNKSVDSEETEDIIDGPHQSIPSDVDDIDDDEVFFERELGKKFENAKRRKLSDPTTSVSKFEEELADYEATYANKRIPSTSSVLQFWQDVSVKYPTLYCVALIVLAAAGTQVSVERLFSAMKFILNDQRSSLSSGNTRNILLVRGNFEHLDDNFFYKFMNEKK